MYPKILLTFFLGLLLICTPLKAEVELVFHPEYISILEDDPAATLGLSNIDSHSIFPISQLQSLMTVTILDEDKEPENVRVIGKALFYPNPFRLQDGAQLGFKLSESANVDVRIYDMRLQEVYREYIEFDTSETYKKIQFDLHSFDSHLSAGVYIFVITWNGNVISKGKFAVVP